MIKPSLTILFVTIAACRIVVLGQSDPLDVFGHPSNLYKLETELLAGNKTALFRLAEYFESSRPVVDLLGYHRIETTEADVAKRMVRENSAFTVEEIVVSKKTTKKEFLSFLQRHESNLVFSKPAGVFWVTPPEARNIEFEVLEISPARKAELEKKSEAFLKLGWVKEEGIDALISSKDPEALLRIAFHLYKNRSRWNRYYFDEEHDLGLLEHLTGTQIVVKNHRNEFSHHIGADYEPDSRLNLLSYFGKFYKDYRFDVDRRTFVNSNLITRSKPIERVLFEGLSNEDDDQAFKAFVELSEMDPTATGKLADEYARASIDRNTNSNLPIFPFRFLKQLTLLTDYCRKHGIDYKGSGRIRSHIESLKKNLPIADRYRLENQIINELRLSDTTAFEYWALIYSSEWDLTYSAGRILDKAYGQNWNELVHNDKNLRLYLMKSKLFDSIGIIGAVNKYLDKFIGATETQVMRLKAHKKSDPSIADQVGLAIQKVPFQPKQRIPDKPDVERPKDLEMQLKRFAGIRFLDEKEKYELVTLLSAISYEQIPLAVSYLEKISFVEPSKVRSKYDFLGDDWGFTLVGDFDDDKVRSEFLTNYSKMSQPELYAFYLTANGFDFLTPDNTLDLDKIYEMLKYDVVEAFAGGGGGRRERHVYSLVKLLENKFGTKLGYMGKLCISKGIYSCSSGDRADAWMRFLRENNHLTKQDDSPVSFTYRD